MAPRKRTASATADINGESLPKRRSSRQAVAAASAKESSANQPSGQSSLMKANEIPRSKVKASKKTPVEDAKPTQKTAKGPAKPKDSTAKATKKTPSQKPTKVVESEKLDDGRALSEDTDVDSIPVTNPDAPRHDGEWYWLLKAEPETRLENGIDVRFSIDDLRAKTKPEGWDGETASHELHSSGCSARNHMRNMNAGDKAFFYHSNCKEPGIAGTMEIVKEFSEDTSARKSGTPYYDPKSTKENPRWSLVHVEFRKKFAVPITLKELRELGQSGGPLENMQMLKQSRLSVSRVSSDEWKALCEIADKKAGEAGLEHETGRI
ncbi:hypothetical protein QQS21_010108 [Conoideocrella luteorostrata]|uniref:Thymocyte nuclear protein 1 n=1 Tax=Conoideocrella luteorostrata TaxID=1105319 RepID=A0AAJ0CIE3_9HYPO|nr:hypothetical protein QQS21_010108 [Conoideocrella luteorostrata]